MTATIQTRVDSKLKEQADALFSSIGLDTTSAIRLFLTQAVIQKKIPFESVAPEEFNQETVAAMNEALAISKGQKPAITYDSFDEALNDLSVADSSSQYGK